MLSNCNCDCFKDVYNINNTAYNAKSSAWVNSYLCDFMTYRESNAAEIAVNNPPGLAQGFSLHNGGKLALVYTHNERDDDTSRARLFLIDLSEYKIIDVVDRDTATDNSAARLMHCNSGTSFTDSTGTEYSVTAWGKYAFSTAVTANQISSITTSTPLYIMQDGEKVEYSSATSLTLDSFTGYWYLGGGGKMYKSTATNLNTIPDTYEYLFDIGTVTEGVGGVNYLKRQGCMAANQSSTARNGVLYASMSAPALVVEFNLDESRGAVGGLLAVHNLSEFATGYTGVENECLQWSDYLNCWLVNRNSRYLDEIGAAAGETGSASHLYNHITLWAVGSTVGENLPQSYTDTTGGFTIQAGAERNIFATLDADIMANGYKVGEYIRHTGYKASPFRSLTQALGFAAYLKTRTAHQSVSIVVEGDFASYIRSNTACLNVTQDINFIMLNGSTLPRLNIKPNVSVNVTAYESQNPDVSIPYILVGRGAKLYCYGVNVQYLELQSGAWLTGNAFGNCELHANGQNVISIGALNNTFTGEVYGSMAFIGGGFDGLSFTACRNLLTGV